MAPGRADRRLFHEQGTPVLPRRRARGPRRGRPGVVARVLPRRYTRVEERARGVGRAALGDLPGVVTGRAAALLLRAPMLWDDRKTVPPERYAEVKYDLVRIAYDAETDHWGRPETLLAAEKTGLSILLPRVSPDGRFLLFCMCRYGCFPAFQPSSDLYLMDLEKGTYARLPINSEFSESWHSWSSNSRWIAFSSKRLGGTFTRSFLSFVDETGRAHKPLVLPQRDPELYDSLLKTFSVPELVTGPVSVPSASLVRATRSKESVVVRTPLDTAPPGESTDPYQRAGR